MREILDVCMHCEQACYANISLRGDEIKIFEVSSTEEAKQDTVFQ
jgi:hypothetical protein